ncbi:hypothetical protein BHE74_00013563 [Ensete ventricosum]|nr:hypothetical protein GW17_00032487 [Ensete ventricosum]RWW78219.1 hypothetical protein BHE74_00013563 [Ensete ventricosum]RZR76762.1 hypothetical protein BHM03_00001643 [Ensete ventricosum]
MALRRALPHRFLNTAKASSYTQSLAPPLRSSSSDVSPSLLPNTVFLYHRPVFRTPVGVELVDRIQGIGSGRICLEGLSPPPPTPPDVVPVAEARKVLRAAQMEAVRTRLRGLGRSCVSYAEFFRVCGEVPGVESDVGLASALDTCGAVLVLGDVAQAIESMIPASLAQRSEARAKELKEMEARKVSIDAEAAALVKREMWWGLGVLALQTAGFMRLTFWELSWDVMEPICFYVTSVYFMLGYAFFLRTSRDPSFEGFFHARFAARQKRLMKTHSFDMDRLNELRRGATTPAKESCDCHQRINFVEAVH